MQKGKFYITNAIPYVNAKPHIGHAEEFIYTDVIARYHRLLGEEVASLCGADENALKNVQAAEKEGISVEQLVDKNQQLFQDLFKKLNVQFDVFQRGSNKKTHFPSSQKLWELCSKDIYKKEYEGLYCVGCEQFYTPDELNENGECFEHPGRPLEKVKESNYFFALSKYQDQLLKLIESGEYEIVPDFRKNEVTSFIKSGLQDISISRSNERAKNWGVPVPNDPTQRMYVWFDALNIYQSGIGFGWDEEKYKKWWPADVHNIGKGIIRFHAVYWPAFLLSAGLELPKRLFVHGYITVEGQKMSKTLGNIIDPLELIEKYGVDPLRFYFLKEIPVFGDGDYSETRFKEVYNAFLANGIGNLVARVARLAENAGFENKDESIDFSSAVDTNADYKRAFDGLKLNEAVDAVFTKIGQADKYIDEHKPWELAKDEAKKDELNKVLTYLVVKVTEIATLLQPFLPESSAKVLEQYSQKHIKAQTPLFPRI